jgi:molecular chaperone GrpE (heat shock protein)
MAMDPREPFERTPSSDGGISDPLCTGDTGDSRDLIDPDGLFAALDAVREQARSPVDAPGAETPARPPDASMHALREELTALRLLFENKILRDQTLQGIISRLHESLVDAQADLALKFLRPVLLEIIKLRDELAAIAAKDGAARTTFKDLLQDVDDLLDRQGALPFESPGDRVDPLVQRVKKTEPAENPEDAGLIIKRLRPGFRYYDKVILRPEEVVALARPITPRAEPSGGLRP